MYNHRLRNIDALELTDRVLKQRYIYTPRFKVTAECSCLLPLKLGDS